jgi:hypothetical protein
MAKLTVGKQEIWGRFPEIRAFVDKGCFPFHSDIPSEINTSEGASTSSQTINVAHVT